MAEIFDVDAWRESIIVRRDPAAPSRLKVVDTLPARYLARREARRLGWPVEMPQGSVASTVFGRVARMNRRVQAVLQERAHQEVADLRQRRAQAANELKQLAVRKVRVQAEAQRIRDTQVDTGAHAGEAKTSGDVVAARRRGAHMAQVAQVQSKIHEIDVAADAQLREFAQYTEALVLRWDLHLRHAHSWTAYFRRVLAVALRVAVRRHPDPTACAALYERAMEDLDPGLEPGHPWADGIELPSFTSEEESV